MTATLRRAKAHRRQEEMWTRLKAASGDHSKRLDVAVSYLRSAMKVSPLVANESAVEQLVPVIIEQGHALLGLREGAK